MAKVKAWEDRLFFHCPGCNIAHWVDGSYKYNGNPDLPTFTPSIVLTWEPDPLLPKRICHSTVTKGKIKFEADSTHAHAGKTMDLPDWEERGN